MFILKGITRTTFCFFILIFAGSSWAQQSTYFFKQRAIMMAQLEYEKNLDLMLLDPENCQVPLKKEDRIRVLKANIKSLNEVGKFSHCRDKRFLGRRRIIDALRRQRASVQQIKNFDDPNGLVVNNNGNVNDAPIPDIEAIIEPEDDTILPESGTSLSNYGTPPSEPVILSGYAGLPYASTPISDETFYYFPPVSTKPPYFRSQNLPPGLSFTHESGVIFGVPNTPGFYSPQVEVGHWEIYGGKKMVFRGPVGFNILPTPKHTVLNPTQRNWENIVRFSKSPAPFLNVQFINKMNDGRSLKYGNGVRTFSGARSGKYYYEAKIHDLGESGAIGWDIGNSSNGGGLTFGGKSGVRFSSSFPIQISTLKTDVRKLKKGDILMSAIDIDKKMIWYGVNGAWSGFTTTNPEIGLNPFVAPEFFDQSFGINNSSSPYKVIDKNTEFRAFVEGFNGTHVTMNFGDQPWEYEPPKGFIGIPNAPISEPIANFWDSNTASEYVIPYPLYWTTKYNYDGNLTGNGFSSHQFYSAGEGGDLMLGMSPKKSGRWQFEIIPYGYSERTRVGIAPVGVNKELLQKSGLGAAGSGSIGLRRLDEAASQTGKGVIEVDGKKFLIDRYDEDSRFTFDCDFDQEIVKIYANGVFLLETKLPQGEKKYSWTIAATSASGAVHMITHPLVVKYPVKGAKLWNLDTEVCENCSVQKPVIAEEKEITCPVENVILGGDIYSVEKHGADYPFCTVPETPANQIAVCEIPGKQYACTDSSLGPKTHCSYYMDTYNSAERCEQECRSSSRRVKMLCAKRGDWTPSAR